MVCVDTDFLIDLSNREEGAIVKLKEVRAKGDTVHTTIVNYHALNHVGFL